MIVEQILSSQCAQYLHAQLLQKRFYTNDSVTTLQADLYRAICDYNGIGSNVEITTEDLAIIDFAVLITPLVIGDALYPASANSKVLIYQSYHHLMQPFVHHLRK
jgi:hypothetical protein